MRAVQPNQAPHRRPYDIDNPVIGVRLDRATYERALRLRKQMGLSFGALFRDALGLVEKDVALIWQRARAESKKIGRKLGYAEATAKIGPPTSAPSAAKRSRPLRDRSRQRLRLPR